MAKRKKPVFIGTRDIVRAIRKPLPRQRGAAHTPKTAYSRKRAKRELLGHLAHQEGNNAYPQARST